MPTRITTIEEMRRLEAEADSQGVSYAAMMEQAGRAVAEAVLARVEPAQATALVLVGKGNNGGDGLVCARHLHDAGVTVKVYCLQPPDEADGKIVALRERSVFLVDSENDLQHRVLRHLLNSATVVVDAVLGIGIRLPLTGRAAQVLSLARRGLEARTVRPLVVAVDVPSGVDCDTGEVDGAALAADASVTFGAAKVGQFMFPAADYVGELIVAPLGWPEAMPGLQAVTLELAEAARVRAALPQRKREAHKYDYGRLLIAAGSQAYVGAAYLAGAAATRSGAGLVTLATPEPVQAMLAPHLVEATWLPVAHASGFVAGGAAAQLAQPIEKCQALVLGPGLGMADSTRDFVAALLDLRAIARAAILIDADGLRLLAQIENWPGRLPKPAVLTPHPGEMQALTGVDKDLIQRDRLGVARRYAAEWGHIVLLKGAFTVVAAPDGRAALEPFATPALAKAGSGDVLAGLIGSLLAQGLEPFEAAVAGAFIHGRAGEAAGRALGTAVSVSARDLIDALPTVFASLERGQPG